MQLPEQQTIKFLLQEDNVILNQFEVLSYIINTTSVMSDNRDIPYTTTMHCYSRRKKEKERKESNAFYGIRTF